MYLLHYIIPAVLYKFLKNKEMLFGLILANLIDLDHIYYRIIGRVGWFESACSEFGRNCSLGFYPLHNWNIAIILFPLIIGIFQKDKRLQLGGWIYIGFCIHLILDSIHQVIGFGV